MQVFKVGKSVLRGWMRTTSIREVAKNRFMNHVSTMTSEENFDFGRYAVVEMDIDINDPDFYQFEYVNFFRSDLVAQNYVEGVLDRNQYTSFPLHVEVWEIVDDTRYYNDDYVPNYRYLDDDTYFTDDAWDNPHYVSPKQFQVAFADIDDVADYVRTAIGDEYINDFDVYSIAHNLVFYDSRCSHYLIKPIYRAYTALGITNSNFWNLVYSFDRSTKRWEVNPRNRKSGFDI